jgi:hypothetical protein
MMGFTSDAFAGLAVRVNVRHCERNGTMGQVLSGAIAHTMNVYESYQQRDCAHEFAQIAT